MVYRFLIAGLITTSLWAETLTFKYQGLEEGYEAIYSCPYVKEQAQNYLTAFGANDLIINCEGGLVDVFKKGPLKVTAQFKRQSAPSEVNIKSDSQFSACPMNTRLIKAIISTLGNYTVVEKKDRCSHPRNPFFFKLKLTSTHLN